MYVDFQELKRLTTLERVAEWLGLAPKNNRMQCPINQGDKRELVINPAKQMFYCFGCQEGGDLIKLAAHVNQVDQKRAALAIQKHFRNGYEPAKKGLPEGGLDYLEPEHERVKALGFNTDKAKELGIGLAPRGTMRNHVLIPIRDDKGKLQGYIGIPEGSTMKLPKDFMPPPS